MTDKHSILGGKVYVYKRPGSPVWQCSTYLEGKNRRVSTKEESLSKAKDFAEDWYLELRAKKTRGELSSERTFKQASERFEREYAVITAGERNAHYVDNHMSRLRNHLVPFFGNMGLSEITAGAVQDYRVFRLTGEQKFKPPSRSTMHHEIVTLRQVLKLAMRHNWISALPDFSEPYKASNKITHRAWFSPDEYKALYQATRANAKANEGKAWHKSSEQLHDMILFLANTGLRPDEAKQLQYRDVEIVEDQSTNETILEISVRGKRGVGYCKSMPGAVMPYKRIVERNVHEPNDLVFPADHKKQFNRILE